MDRDVDDADTSSAGYAAGGMVRGLDPASGLPYSDTIPALLEPGVLVLTPGQVWLLGLMFE